MKKLLLSKNTYFALRRLRKGAASRVETTLGKPDEPAPGQWTPGRNGYCTHGAFSENAGNLQHDGAVEGNGDCHPADVEHLRVHHRIAIGVALSDSAHHGNCRAAALDRNRRLGVVERLLRRHLRSILDGLAVSHARHEKPFAGLRKH